MTGEGIKRFRRAVRLVMMARRFLAVACRVGVSITNDPPHTVLAVTELMDAKGYLQGEEGYSNAHVHKGDTLVQIDGQPAEYLGIGGVKDALFGPPNSIVLLVFQRENGIRYQVRVQRHMIVSSAGVSARISHHAIAARERSKIESEGKWSPSVQDENPIWLALQALGATLRHRQGRSSSISPPAPHPRAYSPSPGIPPRARTTAHTTHTRRASFQSASTGRYGSAHTSPTLVGVGGEDPPPTYQQLFNATNRSLSPEHSPTHSWTLYGGTPATYDAHSSYQYGVSHAVPPLPAAPLLYGGAGQRSTMQFVAFSDGGSS